VYVLQANFFSWFNIDGIQPNLFVVLALVIGIFTSKKVGLIAGFIMGLYTDFLFSNSIGITAVLLAIVGYSGTLLKNKFSSESKITLILMESIVTLIFEFFIVAYRAVFIQAYIDFGNFAYSVFVELVFNALLVIILYPLINKFGGYLENKFGSKELLTRYF
jgi:rod shape-determining protein MreD